MKSAQQGDPDSMFKIGYFSDNGTPQNASVAASWYEKAANKGSRAAQYNMGLLY